MEIQIEVAKPEDAEGIQKVFYDTWLNTYPNNEHGISKEDIMYRHRNTLSPERIAEVAKNISTMKEDEQMLVAKEGEKIVGVGYFTKNEDRNKLQAMYIIPKFQGKGVGTKLWERAQKFFNKEKDVYVDVVTYNIPAINFYKKLGFEDTGKRFTEERFRMKSGSIMEEMEMILRSHS